jgi:hypothetical protein
MTRRRVVQSVTLIGAAVAGAVVAVAVRGGAPAPGSAAPPPVGTATVVRTTLTTTVLTEGTLGYAPSEPVVNRTAGTYTQLPEAGAAIDFGQSLYRVDNDPVVLMDGATPAWRSFESGMTDGPDVVELQTDLIAMGDAAGLLSSPSGRFDQATADAVERWQRSVDLATSGQINLGQIVFLPSPVLVGALSVALGQTAAPGDVPYVVTTTARVVSVPLNPDLPGVNVGEGVSIVLPTGSTTPGTITGVGPATPNPGSSSNSASSSSSADPSVATVTPDDPSSTGTASDVPVQVSLTTQSVSHVLAAPIAALLALAGGGYGVEVVGPSGVHRLVGVTTGLFTGRQVQISGPGIEPGTKVVVAQ